MKTLSRDIIVPDNAVRMAHSAATSAETARMEGGLFDAYKAIATSLENVAAMNQPPVFETNTRILANLFEVYTFKTERAFQMLQEHSAAGACGTESLHESFLWAACGAISKMLIGDLAIDEDYESISGWQAPLACARVVLKKESASKSSMLQNLVQLLDWVVRDTTCCFSDASVDAIFGVIQALVCGPASSSYITREMSPGFMTDECGGDVLKVCEQHRVFQLLWEAADQFETRPNVAILAVEVLSATIRGHWADEVKPVKGRHEARVEVVLSKEDAVRYGDLWGKGVFRTGAQQRQRKSSPKALLSWVRAERLKRLGEMVASYAGSDDVENNEPSTPEQDKEVAGVAGTTGSRGEERVRNRAHEYHHASEDLLESALRLFGQLIEHLPDARDVVSHETMKALMDIHESDRFSREQRSLAEQTMQLMGCPTPGSSDDHAPGDLFAEHNEGSREPFMDDDKTVAWTAPMSHATPSKRSREVFEYRESSKSEGLLDACLDDLPRGMPF